LTIFPYKRHHHHHQHHQQTQFVVSFIAGQLVVRPSIITAASPNHYVNNNPVSRISNYIIVFEIILSIVPNIVKPTVSKSPETSPVVDFCYQ
jgi:hypothetical protein